MEGGHAGTTLGHFRSLVSIGRAGDLTDGQLLERFTSRRGEVAEAAFAALVQRHGSMVWGVCRRVLRDSHAAEDAFQATFLVLIKRAGSIRVDDLLGRWLHGVSCRVAMRAKVASARLRSRESQPVEDVAAAKDGAENRLDVTAVLDEELNRLPEKYRTPLVLCHLEGQSREMAAYQLGCPVGTIRGRLCRARRLLKARLIRRGFAVPAGLLTTVVCPRTAPAGLVNATARVALRLGSTRAISAGLISTSVVTLIRGEMRLMTLMKLKVATAILLATGAAAAGTGLLDEPGSARDIGPVLSSTIQTRGGAIQTAPESSPPKAKPIKSGPATDPAPAHSATLLEKDRNSKLLLIEEKLNEPISLNMNRLPLGDAINFIRNYTGLHFVVDPKALVEEDLASSSPVSIACTGIKLKSALKYLLQPLGLTYRVDADAEILLITTPVNTMPLITAPPGSPEWSEFRVRFDRLRAKRTDLLAKLRETDGELGQLLSIGMDSTANMSLARTPAKSDQGQPIDGLGVETERRLRDIEQKLDRVLRELEAARRKPNR
jgi:RNA polymerase sigma factor (sigma-70 family)